MDQRQHAASGLATAMLGGQWSRVALLGRCRVALGRGRSPRWLVDLADDVLATYRQAPVDRPRELAHFITTSSAWEWAWRHRRPPKVTSWSPTSTRIVQRRWPVAELNDHADLAALLDLDQGELAWFADLRMGSRCEIVPLQHYRWHARARPHARVRLIAAPKPRLKEIQRRLLRHVLAPIPLHDAAHGGVPGRSVRTALAPHSNSAVVIRCDLASFFTSIPAGRIWNLLQISGLPEGVSHTLTGLMTTRAPISVLREHASRLEPADRVRLRTPHLALGAPTSPQVANLLCFTLDRRLDGLAEHFGARYTRYIDDLAFSGGPYLRAHRSRFVALVAQIVKAEGFALNDAKTVVLGAAGRQAMLGAVVVVGPDPE